ncbi:BTAD domain-containing putative transcriptional regulator [Streptomyces sp. NPDC052052]|uniref:AfsR/SARP family transcriptional regulator n=1 Tax=Streptomyces sp. NPDC052052 TaxID=3154756 RepID=UPI003442B07D
MEFRLLGPVEARDGARRVALSGSKVHTVLAALLLARGRVVSDGRLSELLWGWDPPATMNAQIYTYISRLRKLLGPHADLVRRPPGYQLVVFDARVDAVEFERLHEQGVTALREGRLPRASGLLREALALWRGPALSNVSPHLAEAELPQLEEAHTSCLEHRIEADLMLGRHQQLVSELTGLVTEWPVRERLRAQLMTALYRCGRQADALRLFHEGRAILAEELGVDPGPDLVAAYQDVLTGAPKPPVRLFAAPAPAARPFTLPPALADFTARQAEFDELCAALAPPADGARGTFRPRRMLITGMAGIGKTALAVQAAHAMAGEFPDGLLYAPLRQEDGRPQDVAVVLARLLRALGAADEVRDGGDRLEDLIRAYRTRTAGRRVLIVLDGAVNELHLDALLPSTTDAAVLVTSRSRLNAVPGSHTVALAPLDGAESLALLASVAGRQLVERNPQAAELIVGACAGLPLALRAAAARLSARPHWPASRLAGRLADPALRLAELATGGLDTGARLDAALRQRPGDERETARRLAPLKREPFTARDAAEELGVAEDAAEELLERMVEGAVLTMPGIDTQGRPRYRFHALMRLAACGHGACVPAPH